MKYHSALRVNACLLAMLVISGSVSAATQINALFMTQAAYSENDIRAMTSDFEKQHPDVKVNLEFVPYEALHDKIVAARGAGGNGYDVVLFDAIWPAEFSRFDLLQDVSSRIAVDEREKIFPGAMNTVVYQGKTLGMPWILDTKYLYYNKAMLDKAGIKTPPASWQQVMDDAKVLKDKGIVKYPLVWSWSQAEALVCDYTTLVSGFGGSFYQNGKLDFSTPASLKAVTLMKTSLDQGLSNPASREYLEEDVRKAFSNGDAAFALNWTYMYNMANDPKQSKVAGDVGIVPAPGDTPDKPGAVNGSMGLGIAKASQHPEEAWQYIHYLTSQPVQDKYAKLSLPVWKASYQDPAVAKGQESLIAAADKSLNVMLSRPETADYSRLSNTLQQQLQSVLQGKATPDVALKVVDTSAARLR
ncbi:sugar ABC transporter periplasmic sugar-binding protein [Klebsiella quasipneumoniae]|uniref:extracellular solute-binding protein n=1 Tax=Klebsiella TaxID=570 RepID=UPI000E2D5D81|nr:extracellular solute-binding protein [Klebsiella quasipneumoniae]HDZ9750643.1 extracellular solute-binding protein [Klebsiella quasipneumoniae subsp. similipneumoniae]NWM02548.1 extracellular solute-binding protein [Klebsiella quasipneumoniae]SXD05209.1 sugar ABC transporter periplasmic sugar-binding protein [Klebsiella quasipneumoniae]SXD36899.1 sugar ABC transporter periplasmic sugar-binding protein [Klebsiella quasipneumoniae]VAS47015.1 sugar ABC transporter periplasmic sugar-binding pro